MIAVTGATGKLGRLVIEQLLKTVPAGEIVAAVRTPANAADLAARGVVVREADYDRPETLVPAFAGVRRLLLISGSEMGRRAPQHQAVIDAARAVGVGQIVYTSILHADTSPLGLAVEHRATEAALRASGVPHVLLRNGWYSENYLGSIPVVLEHGALPGSAGQGRISAAARADYAAAAAAVLADGADHDGAVFELAGDQAFTLADLAAEIARQSGRPVAYRDLPHQEYRRTLVGFGLPEGVADLVADSDAGAAKGALFDAGGTLGALIGRPTVPISESVAAALQAARVDA